MFNEDLALQHKLGLQPCQATTNIINTIKTYVEAIGEEIDYPKILSDPTLGFSDDNYNYGVEIHNNGITLNRLYFTEGVVNKEFSRIEGGLFFPKTNSALLVKTSDDEKKYDIDYYNSDSVEMMSSIGGFNNTVIDGLASTEYITPDESFEATPQNFSEVFKEAVQLVKAPDEKHM